MIEMTDKSSRSKDQQGPQLEDEMSSGLQKSHPSNAFAVNSVPETGGRVLNALGGVKRVPVRSHPARRSVGVGIYKSALRKPASPGRRVA
jgi:hypothetical protein